MCFRTTAVCSDQKITTGKQGEQECVLGGKNAVIYGAGGSIGGAVARAFAREGATVFLAGRTLESLEEVAEEIRSAGGVAETAHVDALDEHAVDGYVDAVAEKRDLVRWVLGTPDAGTCMNRS